MRLSKRREVQCPDRPGTVREVEAACYIRRQIVVAAGNTTRALKPRREFVEVRGSMDE